MSEELMRCQLCGREFPASDVEAHTAERMTDRAPEKILVYICKACWKDALENPDPTEHQSKVENRIWQEMVFGLLWVDRRFRRELSAHAAELERRQVLELAADDRIFDLVLDELSIPRERRWRFKAKNEWGKIVLENTEPANSELKAFLEWLSKLSYEAMLDRLSQEGDGE